MFQLVALVLLLIIGISALVKFISLRRKINELKVKTTFATKGESLLKVSFESGDELSEIANNFNSLAEKYQLLRTKSDALSAENEIKKQLGSQLKGYEATLSQITMLTDIGMKITASLNVNEIVQVVHQYTRSSMDMELLELMYYTQNTPVCLDIDKSNKIRTYELDESKKTAQAMRWCIENGKEVFLNDAAEDFAQYVYEPIYTFSGLKPAALICVPLFLHGKSIGSIGVASVNKEVFNAYHLEFLRTIASYLAVALDNSNVYGLLEDGKKAIEVEMAKSDELLLNILPAEIATELKENGKAEARSFDMVSILFTDFKDFTGIAEKLTARELVSEVNHCFCHFDQICEKYGIEKIKTIGDSYMAAGGIPVPSAYATRNTVLASLEMNQFIKQRRQERERLGEIAFEMRSGIHTGPVVAGIVGLNKFQYDLWGDTVNTASRMESRSEAGEVNISHATYVLIKDDPAFIIQSRGKLSTKGKGEMEMYFVSKAPSQA